MDQTPNLKLPYIAPSQAQKHVTHNEAIRVLDTIVHLFVISREVPEPPLEADEGERYIIPSNATGAWASNPKYIAEWQDGGWTFFQPQHGWLAWIVEEACFAVFDGLFWIDISVGANPIAHVGINTLADDTNRLSLKSPASLFDHEDGGHQLKINKLDDQHLASILFQSGYSGRAEIGTIWNSNFSIKTSVDGNQWHDVMVANNGAGTVQFPGGVVHTRTGRKLSGLMFLSDMENAILAPAAETARVASVSGDLLTLGPDIAANMFASDMRGVAMVRIWNIGKSPAQSAWAKWDTAANQLQVSNPDDIRQWTAGDAIQTLDPKNQRIFVDISPLMQKYFGSAFPQDGVLLKVDTTGDLTFACTEPSPASSSNLVVFGADEKRRFRVVGVYG
ncbi:DUF2793 domain-containing protein [Phyllobacterium sp. 628]|uniref:DUF2793 domain-containing protein n=1 Tax=Phyllobacterium sp. 628 TaxID=2718938 RepID=UPI0016624DA6|nr:DUF2793 domain-containing protein [Phyllobacterium sp. 628]QND52274.1 DUF2793 domain-containing protein [Phyllobacterium sp. 628]